MKCGIWQPVKCQLFSPLWPGSKMKCFSSYLRINNGDHFIFFIHFKNERLTEILQLSGATFYDRINTIYQFIKPFLNNKMSIFEEYGAFKDISPLDASQMVI